MFLQLWPSYIVQTRQTAGLRAMAGKIIKLEKEAVCEILVADTASELGAEVMLKTSLRQNNNKKRNNNNNNKPQQKSP